MKTFKITETYTGHIKYIVKAKTKEGAMELYEDGEYEIYTDYGDRYNYKFYSIEEDY